MSLTCGFYNSIKGDRKYNAIQHSSIFDGIILDGIFMTVGDSMMVTASNPASMTVLIGEGRAWFNHTWSLNDAPYPIVIDASEAILDRIDAVVLEVNANTSSRINSFKVIKGTPASSPSKPTLAKGELLNQYPLAYIRVPKGATSISQSNITNAVGTSECPFVTGLLEGMNIDALIAKWEAQFTEWSENSESEFNTWFDEMKDQLSTDAAGNLQNQVNKKAPISHASSSETYGKGTGTLFGHVKLSDTLTSDSDATGGVAATPKAVKAVNSEAVNARAVADAAMPKTGGTFTGTVAAKSQNISGYYLRNIVVRNSATANQSTNFIIMDRK